MKRYVLLIFLRISFHSEINASLFALFVLFKVTAWETTSTEATAPKEESDLEEGFKTLKKKVLLAYDKDVSESMEEVAKMRDGLLTKLDNAWQTVKKHNDQRQKLKKAESQYAELRSELNCRPVWGGSCGMFSGGGGCPGGGGGYPSSGTAAAPSFRSSPSGLGPVVGVHESTGSANGSNNLQGPRNNRKKTYV